MEKILKYDKKVQHFVFTESDKFWNLKKLVKFERYKITKSNKNASLSVLIINIHTHFIKDSIYIVLHHTDNSLFNFTRRKKLKAIIEFCLHLKRHFFQEQLLYKNENYIVIKFVYFFEWEKLFLHSFNIQIVKLIWNLFHVEQQ